jgi:hypothetical protein
MSGGKDAILFYPSGSIAMQAILLWILGIAFTILITVYLWSQVLPG